MKGCCPSCGAEDGWKDTPVREECHVCGYFVNYATGESNYDKHVRNIERRRAKEATHEYRAGPSCPKCGSHNFVQAAEVDVCEDCDYAQSYM